MKTVYLHIGFGKTGTSSVQLFSFNNREKLIELGLLYPTTGLSPYAHHDLAPYQTIEMPGEIGALYKILVEEIARSHVNRVLISSENFCFLEKSHVVKIKEFLSVYHVKIIFYVRNQVKLIESTFLQWQREGWQYENSIERFYNEHKASFDFSLRIQPWIEEFGIDSIIVRVYDSRTIGGDTCLDVMKILGVELGREIENSNTRENPSLIPELSTLISIIDKSEMTRDARKEIVNELLTLSGALKSSSTHKLIGEELRKEIDEYYEISNRAFSLQLLKQEEAAVFLSGRKMSLAV